jgi:hypothetical protein
MSFRGSVSYIAAGQVTIPLPMMVDLSGNSPSQCYFTHGKMSLAAATTSVAVVFDNRPAITYNGGNGSIFVIPVGAKTATVTPTGGNAVIELGTER